MLRDDGRNIENGVGNSFMVLQGDNEIVIVTRRRSRLRPRNRSSLVSYWWS